MTETNDPRHPLPKGGTRTFHIVLIGPMCSGKSAVARELSMLSGQPWTDLDAEFVSEHGPIPAFIEQHGFEAFREAESAILVRALRQSEPKIIATGGGVVLAEANRAVLSDQVAFWLDVSPQAVVARMRGGANRPLLAGDDPLETWKSIRAERTPLYRECGIGPIDTSASSPRETARALQGMLDAASTTDPVSVTKP